MQGPQQGHPTTDAELSNHMLPEGRLTSGFSVVAARPHSSQPRPESDCHELSVPQKSALSLNEAVTICSSLTAEARPFDESMHPSCWTQRLDLN